MAFDTIIDSRLSDCLDYPKQWPGEVQISENARKCVVKILLCVGLNVANDIADIYVDVRRTNKGTKNEKIYDNLREKKTESQN